MILAESWWHILLATLFALLALLLMGVILLQRGRGMGLSNAFGGGGAAATVFGSKTGDFLTWATITLAGLFLLYSVTLNYIFVPPPPDLSPPAPAAPMIAPGPNTPEAATPVTAQPPADATPPAAGGSTPAGGTAPSGGAADGAPSSRPAG